MNKFAAEQNAIVEAMQKIASANGLPLTYPVAQKIAELHQYSPILIMKTAAGTGGWLRPIPMGGLDPSSSSSSQGYGYTPIEGTSTMRHQAPNRLLEPLKSTNLRSIK